MASLLKDACNAGLLRVKKLAKFEALPDLLPCMTVNLFLIELGVRSLAIAGRARQF